MSASCGEAYHPVDAANMHDECMYVHDELSVLKTPIGGRDTPDISERCRASPTTRWYEFLMYAYYSLMYSEGYKADKTVAYDKQQTQERADI